MAEHKSTEEIMKLPPRSVRIAGLLQQGLWDADTGTIYLIDKNGTLTGRCARITPPPMQDHPVPASDLVDKVPVQGGQIAVTPTKGISARHRKHQQTKREQRGQFKLQGSKRILLFLGCCLLIILAVCAALLPRSRSTDSGPISSPPSLASITVIQVNRDLMPGEVLTESDIQAAPVSSEVYNQISLTGTNLYQWDRRDGLIGMYASAFLPKGQYLSYSSISSVFEVPLNPWGNSSGQVVIVDVPLTEATPGSYTLGSNVDIVIQRRTTTEVQSEPPETISFGTNFSKTSSVSQSTRIDEFTISNVTIANLITADGLDLYRLYFALASIPAGEQLHYLSEQMTDPAFVANVTPRWIRILITQEASDILGDLYDGNTSAVIRVTDGADTGSTEKADMYAKAKALDALLNSICLGGDNDARE